MSLKKILIGAGVTAVLVAGYIFVTGGPASAVAPVSITKAAVVQPGPNTVGTAQLINSGVWGPDIHDNTIPLSKMGYDFRQAIESANVSKPNSVNSSTQIAPGTIDYSDLNAALQARVDSTTPGAPGADAILSVTADTMVTGRPDTATDATVWANDSMTRTLTVVRQHATKASDCGAGAVKCYFYTGTIKDNGTFTTVAGAHGPNSATPISGVVNGNVNGVYEIEFYATSDLPNSSNVDSTVSGSSPSTSNWMKMAFPAGTQFNGFTGVDYKWVYTAPATCETHTQQTSGNSGDILGVNHC